MNKHNSVENPTKTAGTKRTRVSKPTKTTKILALLRRSGGASMKELQKATDWQAHSVRGFISGMLKNKMGLDVVSTKGDNGERTYLVSSK